MFASHFCSNYYLSAYQNLNPFSQYDLTKLVFRGIFKNTTLKSVISIVTLKMLTRVKRISLFVPLWYLTGNRSFQLKLYGYY